MGRKTASGGRFFIAARRFPETETTRRAVSERGVMRKGKKAAIKNENKKARAEADVRKNEEDHTLPLMLDRKQLLRHTGLSYAKILSLMKRGEFPRPRRVGRKNLWITSEVIEWMLKQPVSDLKSKPGLKGYKEEKPHAS
jgi:predicted DNA-binding transcriptional regulator AlpA